MSKNQKMFIKLFVVRKYVMAKSAQEAIRKEKIAPVDDVWIDEDWKRKGAERLESAIGFVVPTENDQD